MNPRGLKKTFRKHKGILVSITCHLALTITMFQIGSFSLSQLNATMIPIIEDKSIDVQIYSDVTSPKEQINKMEKVSKVEFRRVEDIEHDVIKIQKPIAKEKSIPSPKVKKTGKSSAKYEEVLSRHFLRIANKLPRNFANQDAFILIKIDQSGHIRDFSFKPSNLSGSTLNFLESILSLASPVPSPPNDSQETHHIQQYLIPINLR